MRGRAKAGERDFERSYFTAWASANFFRADKLKRFSAYLAAAKPKRTQSGDEVLALFKTWQSAGIPLKIRKVK